MSRPLAAEYEPHVEVLKTTTGKEPCAEGPAGFTGIFKDRFERISRVLCASGLNGAARDIGMLNEIAGLQQMSDRRTVAMVGMIANKHRSVAGNAVIELEDPSGTVIALAFKDSAPFSKSEYLVLDEVVGVVGLVRKDGGDRARIFVNDIIWPDLPPKQTLAQAPPNTPPLSAALISDLHVGSSKFLEESLVMRSLSKGTILPSLFLILVIILSISYGKLPFLFKD